MTIGPDNPHTVRYPDNESSAWQVVYWCGNAASGFNDADRAELQHFRTRNGWCHIGWFELPGEKSNLDKWLVALALAHDAGKDAKAAEICKTLGITR